MNSNERQLTRGPGGRILTHAGVWSPGGQWIVFDMRSDPAGEVFDGPRIEAVHVETGEVRVLYESRRGAHCGVATWHPREAKAAFILGPENPTPDWRYGPSHRQGVIVDLARPGGIMALDARDLVAPFTPGALRGGSHVHLWDAAGDWVSFTYNDALRESDLRDVGVSVPGRPVRVPKLHPRCHDGEFHSVLVTRTVAKPAPGTDEIQRACEESWIGVNGYQRIDGTRQRRALAFQGHVITSSGETISEVFIADLPEDLTQPGGGPLAGTETQRPFPPRGVTQRRLTFTQGRKFPGLQGPRHWLRSSPDGARIAGLLRDDAGVVQLWTVSPNGGPLIQLTRNRHDFDSAFTWSPNGAWIAHVMDQSVCLTDARTGRTHRVTPRGDAAQAPRPQACVFSPDGRRIAYVRRMRETEGREFNQLFVARGPETGEEF